MLMHFSAAKNSTLRNDVTRLHTWHDACTASQNTSAVESISKTTAIWRKLDGMLLTYIFDAFFHEPSLPPLRVWISFLCISTINNFKSKQIQWTKENDEKCQHLEYFYCFATIFFAKQHWQTGKNTQFFLQCLLSSRLINCLQKLCTILRSDAQCTMMITFLWAYLWQRLPNPVRHTMTGDTYCAALRHGQSAIRLECVQTTKIVQKGFMFALISVWP